MPFKYIDHPLGKAIEDVTGPVVYLHTKFSKEVVLKAFYQVGPNRVLEAARWHRRNKHTLEN